MSFSKNIKKIVILQTSNDDEKFNDALAKQIVKKNKNNNHVVVKKFTFSLTKEPKLNKANESKEYIDHRNSLNAVEDNNNSQKTKYIIHYHGVYTNGKVNRNKASINFNDNHYFLSSKPLDNLEPGGIIHNKNNKTITYQSYYEKSRTTLKYDLHFQWKLKNSKNKDQFIQKYIFKHDRNSHKNLAQARGIGYEEMAEMLSSEIKKQGDEIDVIACYAALGGLESYAAKMQRTAYKDKKFYAPVIARTTQVDEQGNSNITYKQSTHSLKKSLDNYDPNENNYQDFESNNLIENGPGTKARFEIHKGHQFMFDAYLWENSTAVLNQLKHEGNDEQSKLKSKIKHLTKKILQCPDRKLRSSLVKNYKNLMEKAQNKNYSKKLIKSMSNVIYTANNKKTLLSDSRIVKPELENTIYKKKKIFLNKFISNIKRKDYWSDKGQGIFYKKTPTTIKNMQNYFNNIDNEIDSFSEEQINIAYNRIQRALKQKSITDSKNYNDKNITPQELFYYNAAKEIDEINSQNKYKEKLVCSDNNKHLSDFNLIPTPSPLATL